RQQHAVQHHPFERDEEGNVLASACRCRRRLGQGCELGRISGVHGSKRPSPSAPGGPRRGRARGQVREERGFQVSLPWMICGRLPRLIATTSIWRITSPEYPSLVIWIVGSFNERSPFSASKSGLDKPSKPCTCCMLVNFTSSAVPSSWSGPLRNWTSPCAARSPTPGIEDSTSRLAHCTSMGPWLRIVKSSSQPCCEVNGSQAGIW